MAIDKIKFFSKDDFIPEQKDIDRAKSCQSIAKRDAQINAISDKQKLRRRCMAFQEYSEFPGMYEWVRRAKELDFTQDELNEFYEVAMTIAINNNKTLRKQVDQLQPTIDALTQTIENLKVELRNAKTSKPSELSEADKKLVDKFKEMGSSYAFVYTTLYKNEPHRYVIFVEEGNPPRGYSGVNRYLYVKPDGTPFKDRGELDAFYEGSELEKYVKSGGSWDGKYGIYKQDLEIKELPNVLWGGDLMNVKVFGVNKVGKPRGK